MIVSIGCGLHMHWRDTYQMRQWHLLPHTVGHTEVTLREPLSSIELIKTGYAGPVLGHTPSRFVLGYACLRVRISDEIPTDCESIQMSFFECANSVRWCTYDGFFMDIKTCIHDAGNTCDLFESFDDTVVCRIVLL